MAHFGATFTQVIEQLQGMNTANTLDISLFGGQVKIEERMEWVYRKILGFTTGDVHAALTQGRFTCHKLIDTARNPAQTFPDPGQGFPGDVIEETYRQQLNTPLTPTDAGDNLYSITSNEITINSVSALADTVYADYDVDPLTIKCPSLAGLLVRMTADYLAEAAINGGSGDDGGITDRADESAIEQYTELQDLKKMTSVSSLLQLNLCDPVGGGNSGIAVMKVCG